MSYRNQYSIGIAGSGNVGWHLGMALFNAGWNVQHIYSRTLKNARELATRIQAKPTKNISDLNDCHIIICCLPDDVLPELLSNKNFPKGKILLHSSGSLDIAILKSQSPDFGSLYPLQTFRKSSEVVDFNEIPVFIEASNAKTLKIVQQIALSLSPKVVKIDSKQRRFLHIAAVFACNFSNHMYTLADEICQENKIDFNWLVPLILKTAQNVSLNPPAKNQTGPAVRNDFALIQKHLEVLSEHPELKDIYSSITNSIFVRNKNNRHA